MTAEHPEGGTLRQALEEKIQQWQNEAHYLKENADEYSDPVASKGAANSMLDMCDELEALLEEHRPVDDPPGPTAKYPPSENNDV